MNFEDSPEEAKYRARVRSWIAENAPDMSALGADERRNWHPKHKEIARRWQATKADAGLRLYFLALCLGRSGRYGDRGSDIQPGRSEGRRPVHVFHDGPAHAAAGATGA